MEQWLETPVKWLLGPETQIPSWPRPQLLTQFNASPGAPSRTAASEPTAAPEGLTHFWPRWIFLRALGLIYFSAFYALLFQIKGLIGPAGILPAADYLQAVGGALHSERFWFAPTLFWISATDHALMVACWVGLIASALLFFNVWPRAMLLVSFLCFISFVGAAQVFSGYQSDGMLLEAGFLSLFFAPEGFWPGLGRDRPPSRASIFLLRWEWFCIYFGSGVAKLASGDTSWRNFTAMDDYYQNGPLPTWIGWYVGHFPHWFHASAVFYTFAIELVLCWMLFLPRRFRIALFFIVTPFEISIILTANYAFLNYIVFSLGFLLLDDRFVEWIVPRPIRGFIEGTLAQTGNPEVAALSAAGVATPLDSGRRMLTALRMCITGACLGLIFYATFVRLAPIVPLPTKPAEMLAPLRIADGYGLFATMTHSRYEIEFQGSNDGKTWTAYPFRYKPQDPRKAPGIYAPYQPRFDWNLWFASLESWRQHRWVIWTEERLLDAQPQVLQLFAGNPFAGAPPQFVRAVIYQYWFTNQQTKRQQGTWWRRELLGQYAPELERQADGRFLLIQGSEVGPAEQ
jgi:hypothetical protein